MTKPLPLPDQILSDPVQKGVLAARIAGSIRWPDNDADCWEWIGSKFHYGHGKITVVDDRFDDGRRRNVMVHRITYAWWYGDTELPVDHMCGNTSCVYPKHLQAVTVQVNTLRGNSPTAFNAQKDRCVNGHPLYGDNLQIVSGRRRCRACSNERNRISKDKNNYGFGGKGTRQFKRNGPGKTHCKNGHEWIPENIYWRKRGHAECMVCHRERERARQQRLRETPKPD